MAKVNTSSPFISPKDRFRPLSSPTSSNNQGLLNPGLSSNIYELPASLQNLSNIDPANPIYQLLTGPGDGDTVANLNAYLGISLGYLGIPQLLKNATYTLTINEANYHIYKSDTSAYTWTIPANSAVAFDIGTCVTFINGGSAGNISIAITTDTLRQVSTGSTGTRTLASYGMATAIKVAATTWMINGTGLT